MGNSNSQYKTYDEHIQEALNDVKSGTHLRFVNVLYRTKEVCLAAVTYESIIGTLIFDLHSVPDSHLDYVMENIRELKKYERDFLGNKRSSYLENLEEAYIKIKTESHIPTEITSATIVIPEPVVSSDDYDKLLREIFFKKFGESAV